MAQVSTNLVDWERTGIAAVVSEVRRLAREAGTDIDHCELIGLAPTGALLEVAADTLGLADFSADQALELRLARDRWIAVPAVHRPVGNRLAIRTPRGNRHEAPLVHAVMTDRPPSTSPTPHRQPLLHRPGRGLDDRLARDRRASVDGPTRTTPPGPSTTEAAAALSLGRAASSARLDGP